MKRLYQPKRFLVRQKFLFHLVHDIGERETILGIGEGVAPAGARVAEG